MEKTLDININLMRLGGAQMRNVNVDGTVKPMVLIDPAKSGMKVTETGVWLDMIAWPNKEVSQFGSTHMIKQSFPKEVREAMSDEERKSLPVLGNVKPFEKPTVADEANNQPTVRIAEEDGPSF